MLARATARSLRHYGSPISPYIALPSTQARPYAKHNRPQRPIEHRHGNNNVNPSRSTPSTQRPLDARPKSSDKIVVDSTRREPHPEYSKLQDEFQTSAPADGETAPQSSSSPTIDPAQARQQTEHSQPLPDLTQGIPSTIDAELASGSSAKADPSSLNITEAPSQAGGQGGGDLPKEAYISSLERRQNRWAKWFYITALTFIGTTTIFLGRNWESEEEERKHPEAPSGWGFVLFWNRIKARYNSKIDYYNEPAFPKLLPDPPPDWERPYTLVLSLEDLLVHSEWSREHGWRMAKRPGVDYFLRYLSQYYELVIFTSIPSMTAGPIINKLDPYKIVMWPLFREATRYKDGEYIKDLSFLNRDPSKIILLDTVPSHAKYQPENAIIIPKWKGDPTDKDLVSYIPFLEFIGSMVGPDGKAERDTRSILKDYHNLHIPTEFARRSAIAQEAFKKRLAEEKGKRPRKPSSFLTSLTGKPQSAPAGAPMGLEQSIAEGLDQGKSYQDLIRERGQKQYEFLEREIQQNGEKWLKEMAEEEKKAMDESMKSMRGSLTGYFPFGGAGGKKED